MITILFGYGSERVCLKCHRRNIPALNVDAYLCYCRDAKRKRSNSSTVHILHLKGWKFLLHSKWLHIIGLFMLKKRSIVCKLACTQLFKEKDECVFRDIFSLISLIV